MDGSKRESIPEHFESAEESVYCKVIVRRIVVGIEEYVDTVL